MKIKHEQLAAIQHDRVRLEAFLQIPESVKGIVIFAHGSGSNRHSPRNKIVAAALHDKNLATVLADLLSPEEDKDYDNRFDIDLLTRRLLNLTVWTRKQPDIENLPLGYFGASTGAAAALQAAAQLGFAVKAVVSRGGRPDMAVDIARVTAPTLLIVGGNDESVISLNQNAFQKLTAVKDFAIIPGATHLFEEPGTLDQVTELAAEWFGNI